MANTKEPQNNQGSPDTMQTEHHETGHEPIPDPPPPGTLFRRIVIGGLVAAAVAVVIYFLTK